MLKIVNIDAEAQVILTLLTSTDDVKTYLIQRLTREHFSHKPSYKAYDLISKILKDNFLLPTLLTFLEHPEVTEEIKVWIQKEGIIPVVSIDDAGNLFNILDYYRKLRHLYTLTNYTIEEFNKNEKEGIPDIDKIINKVENTLVSVQSKAGEDKLLHIGKGGSKTDVLDYILNREEKELIPTTFNNFDKVVKGFERSSLLFLASHAKGGKTTMAMNILVNQYLQYNLDVCYISLEMSKEEVKDCIISKISGVEHANIRKKDLSPAERDIVKKAYEKFEDHGIKNNCRFTIWCPSTLTVMEMRLKLKTFNYAVICPDYINLLNLSSDSKASGLHEQLNELAKQLKQTAKYLNAFIICPAQMNKDGDVRYSKSLKEHANNIWRWFYGEEETINKQITVEQLVTRGWAQFPFKLEIDLERKLIQDSYINISEEFNNSQ